MTPGLVVVALPPGLAVRSPLPASVPRRIL